ncbi:aspartic peptidase [Immersiella caudata]|uniref:Aspartic peptidase n=1 Tax=Immersiella caudata TaxID=314043 RepID=A0AA39W9I2_9PEZI|nr:aspartic peptidase [Immersiella caudata]
MALPPSSRTTPGPSTTAMAPPLRVPSSATTVSLGAVTSRYKTVQSASRISRAFTWDAACPGILGLGFLPREQRTTWEGPDIYGQCAPRVRPGGVHSGTEEGETWQVRFGYVDRGARLGRMGYADVTPRDAIWRFMMDGVQAGNETQGKSEGFAAIADTGTSLLLVPRNVVKTYYGLVEGSGSMLTGLGGCFYAMRDCRTGSSGCGMANRGTVPELHGVQQDERTRCFGGMQRPESIPFAILGMSCSRHNLSSLILGRE